MSGIRGRLRTVPLLMAASAASFAMAGVSRAQSFVDLEAGFETPPHSARPRIEAVALRRLGGVGAPFSNGAAFGVLRKPTGQASRVVPQAVAVESTSIEGPWRVRFPADRGGPEEITLGRLASWADHADPGVRFFSGTATYSRELEAPKAWFADGSRIWLDLGDVREVAEVSVNGRELQTLWKRPYRVDVTSALKPGANQLEIRVTNLWPNRLIGDLQPGATRYTFTGREVYQPDSPLLPSGLLGPVSLEVLRTET